MCAAEMGTCHNSSKLTTIHVKKQTCTLEISTSVIYIIYYYSDFYYIPYTGKFKKNNGSRQFTFTGMNIWNTAIYR